MLRVWNNPSLLTGGMISVAVIAGAVLAPWITWWPVDQMDMAHRRRHACEARIRIGGNFGKRFTDNFR